MGKLIGNAPARFLPPAGRLLFERGCRCIRRTPEAASQGVASRLDWMPKRRLLRRT
jgi:hypothetical protein